MTQDTEKSNPELEGIEECFHPVVERYGRAMFALVMNAQMGGQAVGVLASVMEKAHSKHGLHAVQVLANCFNQISNDYVKKMEWKEEDVAECASAIEQAFRTKLIVPPPIVLQ